MPQLLSDAPGTQPRGVNRVYHVPFTCFLAYTPIDGGKRMEQVYYANQLSDYVEGQLTTLCSSTAEEVTFDYTKPIANIPQFGNHLPTSDVLASSNTSTQARLSFSGHICARTSFTKTPIGTRTVICSGEYKTGPGAANASNSVPDAELVALATSFKSMIESATGLTVYRLEIAGFIFGSGGSHF